MNECSLYLLNKAQSGWNARDFSLKFGCAQSRCCRRDVAGALRIFFERSHICQHSCQRVR